MRTQLRDRGFWSGELWNRRKSGENYPVKLSVTAIRNSQNRVTNFVSILYDISIEKAAERSLVEMNQIKSEFISSAAHELRTPLNTLMGYVEFAKDPEKFGGFSQEQIAGFLSDAYDRGDALNQIINDFLDISRVENGYSIELNFEDVNLPKFLRKIVESYQVHNSSHNFKIDFCEQTSSSLCSIDRHRINQVLDNLLSNAVKYSAEGSAILLSLTLKDDQWEISVVDQGIGMTLEQVERVFDKFYRADSANPAVSGLGLGMSIAKKIIELHHGIIRVTSVKGEGTTATIMLPRVSD
jgi:signal transduction histidine kinase